MRDGDQILIRYKHEESPEKAQRNRTLYIYIYIATHVSSMQNKNEKAWGIKMEYNFII